jgi:hypothetical protein
VHGTLGREVHRTFGRDKIDQQFQLRLKDYQELVLRLKAENLISHSG